MAAVLHGCSSNRAFHACARAPPVRRPSRDLVLRRPYGTIKSSAEHVVRSLPPSRLQAVARATLRSSNGSAPSAMFTSTPLTPLRRRGRRVPAAEHAPVLRPRRDTRRAIRRVYEAASSPSGPTIPRRLRHDRRPTRHSNQSRSHLQCTDGNTAIEGDHMAKRLWVVMVLAIMETPAAEQLEPGFVDPAPGPGSGSEGDRRGPGEMHYDGRQRLCRDGRAAAHVGREHRLAPGRATGELPPDDELGSRDDGGRVRSKAWSPSSVMEMGRPVHRRHADQPRTPGRYSKSTGNTGGRWTAPAALRFR